MGMLTFQFMRMREAEARKKAEEAKKTTTVKPEIKAETPVEPVKEQKEVKAESKPKNPKMRDA